MRIVKYAAALAAAAIAGFALIGPAAAASAGGVEVTDLQDGTKLLRGVTSQAQLAAACPDGLFCFYSEQLGAGRGLPCGQLVVNWSGGGWWSNQLTGNNDRVRMFLTNGKTYTTPHSPFYDGTADWTPVTRLLVCVA
jgi:hypothetical protein